MASRNALYLMPSLAVLATAAIVLGPGRERPAVGARIWGVPAAGATTAAWRLETMERQFGSDQALAVDALELSVSQGGARVGEWTGASGEDGVAEALVHAQQPLSGSVEVRIARGRALLAQGAITLRRVDSAAREAAVVEGKAEGPMRLRVQIERGLLAAPFAGALRVRAIGPDGAPVPGLEIKPALQGADEGPRMGGLGLRTDMAGEMLLPIVPASHAIELRLEARTLDGGPPSTWDGGLPVQPGAMWLDPRAGASADGRGETFAVRSPVLRGRAYASVLTAEGRALGAIVPLALDDKGFSSGSLTLPEEVRRRAVGVTISGDPQERGSGTVTWPLDGSDGIVRAPRIEMLLDGVPFAEHREKERAGRARLASVGVALVAALFEAVLLVLYSRASQAKLAAHLAQAAQDDEERAAAARMTAAPASRAFTLVVLVGLVVLGFGAVAAFSIVR